MLNEKQNGRWLVLFCLILAGEMIFSLPFHIARYFRPTVLEAFSLSNAELGDIFAVYGIAAMLAYFPGGIIADRFPARRLLTLSLVMTAAGGFYFATLSDRDSLYILFAYWGVTTILLFWSALIRATREWGGELDQGKAFGLLDGGRGLIAALFASLGVVLFDIWLAQENSVIDNADRQYALQVVIYYYSFSTLLVGALIWYVIPEQGIEQQDWRHFSSVEKSMLKRPVI